MDKTTRPAIAVVGAGPAGLFAAEALAEAGHPVIVYDRMPSVGRKFLIAGRGGLNLTHSEPLADLLDRYRPRADTLGTAIEAFPPQALREWCHGLGQPTFVGSSGRVFPESFKASPLLRAWLTRLDGLGVRIRTRHRFVGWSSQGELVFETPDGAVMHRPGPALLTLGGASWPRLGSDGAWVAPFEAAGITVAPLRPANVGFAVAWSTHLTERFAGTPLKRIALTFEGMTVRGEAVVTEDGIEGGAVYALSRNIREAIARDGEAWVHLDLRPDLTETALARRLGDPKPGQSRSTTLRKAAGLNPVGTALLHEAAGRVLPDGAEIAALIKAVPLRLHATRPIDRAISTAGGVAFSGLDSRFMLRDRPGTFVAGEMLDWEAPTGGYLLQGAFATGHAAARGLLAWLDEERLSRGS